MKRLSILLVSDKDIAIKGDYRYVVIQARNYDEALNHFQNLDFDLVVFTYQSSKDDTFNMINKLIEVQKRTTEILILNHRSNPSKKFIKHYEEQKFERNFNFKITDNTLTTNATCQI